MVAAVELAEGAEGSEGQDRRRGLLLGRRDRQLSWPRALPDLGAGVAFYGSAPDPRGRGQDQGARCIIQSAETDERINAAWPAYETALKAANVKYERHLYPGTQHGFNNDTTPRYDAAAAKLAWDRTIAFFKKNLK